MALGDDDDDDIWGDEGGGGDSTSEDTIQSDTEATTNLHDVCKEEDIGYFGNSQNDGPEVEIKLDWWGCRLWCTVKYPHAKYFSFMSQNNTCWCKELDQGGRRPSGRHSSPGTVSGEISDECLSKGM